MEPKRFKMWQDHSERYLEMACRYDRCEKIEHPDGYGRRTGDCGDTVEIYLSIGRGIIQSVSYQTDGCMNTNACANTVAELAEGRKVADAWEISPENVVAFLKTLPPQNTIFSDLNKPTP